MRRVSALLICLIAICSGLGGCAQRTLSVPPPVVITVQRCARPQTPVMPVLRSDLPLDHPAQVEALLTRDVRLRRYVDGLRAALDCYDKQTKGVPRD